MSSKDSKKYPKDKAPKHATVRLPKELVDAMEEFLKTDLAKKMGFLYKVDLVTVATREILEKYGFYTQTGNEMDKVLDLVASWKEPQTIEVISDELKIPINRCEVIVNFLEKHELIQREGQKFRIGPQGERLEKIPV